MTFDGDLDVSCYLCGEASRDSERDLLAEVLDARTPYSGFVAAETEHFVVLPSIGALTDGHVLICPKGHWRGVARLPDAATREFTALKSLIRSLLVDLYGLPVHGFEHGPSRTGRVPCSVEHAHFHLLPADVSISARLGAKFSWQPFDGSLASLKSMVVDDEYLWYEDEGGNSSVSTDGPYPSQYLRAVFAQALDVSNWNWREHPNVEAVRRSFVSLKSAWESQGSEPLAAAGLMPDRNLNASGSVAAT